MRRIAVFMVVTVLLFAAAAAAGEDAAEIRAGDYVTFGSYPQTAEGTDRTPIEWLVLDVQDGKVWVISRYALDAGPFHAEDTAVTWENCTLRAWLNSDFLHTAFSDGEQASVLLTEVDNSSAQGYGEWDRGGDGPTEDWIFLLSYAEVNRFFDAEHNVKKTRPRVSATAYAIRNGAYTRDQWQTEDGGDVAFWWLRSPGSEPNRAATVNGVGMFWDTDVDISDYSVRPSCWLELQAVTRASEDAEDASAVRSPDGPAW